MRWIHYNRKKITTFEVDHINFIAFQTMLATSILLILMEQNVKKSFLVIKLNMFIKLVLLHYWIVCILDKTKVNISKKIIRIWVKLYLITGTHFKIYLSEVWHTYVKQKLWLLGLQNFRTPWINKISYEGMLKKVCLIRNI